MIHLYKNIYLNHIDKFYSDVKPFFAVSEEIPDPVASKFEGFEDQKVSSFSKILEQDYDGEIFNFWDDVLHTKGEKVNVFCDDYHLFVLFMSFWESVYVPPEEAACYSSGLLINLYQYDIFTQKRAVDKAIENYHRYLAPELLGLVDFDFAPLEVKMLLACKYQKVPLDAFADALYDHIWIAWSRALHVFKDELIVCLNDFCGHFFGKTLKVSDDLNYFLYEEKETAWVLDEELLVGSRKHILEQYSEDFFIKIHKMLQRFEVKDTKKFISDDFFDFATRMIFSADSKILLGHFMSANLPVFKVFGKDWEGNCGLLSFCYEYAQIRRILSQISWDKRK